MGDYRKFLRILENKEPGGAVMFEYRFPEELAEQLIWRRGKHLWDTEAARVRTIVAAAHLSGMDCAAVEFTDDLSGLEGLEKELPDGLKIVAGLKRGLAERMSAGEPCEDAFSVMRERLCALAKNEAVCAIMISDDFDDVQKDDILHIFEHYAQLIHHLKLMNNIHIYCIFVDRSHRPVLVELPKRFGFHALYFSQYHSIDTAQILRDHGDQIAILGDTALSFTATAKPQDIIDYVSSLQSLSKNKGFAFGSGNIDGSPMPYLNYVSILSALLRGK